MISSDEEEDPQTELPRVTLKGGCTYRRLGWFAIKPLQLWCWLVGGWRVADCCCWWWWWRWGWLGFVWQTTGGTSTREWLRPRIQRPFEGVEAQMQGKELTIPLYWRFCQVSLCLPVRLRHLHGWWPVLGPRLNVHELTKIDRVSNELPLASIPTHLLYHVHAAGSFSITSHPCYVVQPWGIFYNILVYDIFWCTDRPVFRNSFWCMQTKPFSVDAPVVLVWYHFLTASQVILIGQRCERPKKRHHFFGRSN